MTVMAAEEIEIVIEIVCTNLPGEEWDGHSTLSLGIQRDDELIEAASAGLTRGGACFAAFMELSTTCIGRSIQ